jgi:2-oxoglutarate/2-oxoacid ferredoxin oxidoreductase subunit beta
MKTRFDYIDIKDTAWCPGCGNFALLNILKETLEELNIDPSQLVISSGIGQAAKLPQYMNSNFFNGLHGRAVPVATAIKAVNPQLIVIAEGGDGDMYGEGGNHFIHAVRRNPDIVHLVHNNMVYGLTQGQASPTSLPGFKTPVQTSGVSNEPFNPLAVALSLGAPFVARTFVGNMELSKKIIKEAIAYKGYALIDIFDPCVSFNKLNSYAWYKENTYILDDSYNPSDKMSALQKVFEADPYPIGILYKQAGVRKTFEQQIEIYDHNAEPVWKRPRTAEFQQRIVHEFDL